MYYIVHTCMHTQHLHMLTNKGSLIRGFDTCYTCKKHSHHEEVVYMGLCAACFLSQCMDIERSITVTYTVPEDANHT